MEGGALAALSQCFQPHPHTPSQALQVSKRMNEPLLAPCALLEQSIRKPKWGWLGSSQAIPNQWLRSSHNNLNSKPTLG